jgi:hypothetical protein
MPGPLRIFIGYDSREPIALHVLSHSILRRASRPVSITPLALDHLARWLYTRERTAKESTEFSFTRFLVPYLSGYQGHSIFMDCDMLCLADIHTVMTHIGGDARTCPPEAVWVVMHDYVPRAARKFLGQTQLAYPRKNWSSFVVFNNERCRALTPEYVNTATGLELHRFQWLADEQIGSLPLQWNWLVEEYGYDAALDDCPWHAPLGDALIAYTDPPKILHYTNGGPWFDDYKLTDHAQEWFDEFNTMTRPTFVGTADHTRH